VKNRFQNLPFKFNLQRYITGRDMYPFELPTLLFKHPTLRFEEGLCTLESS
jgi:hypothetical protein